MTATFESDNCQRSYFLFPTGARSHARCMSTAFNFVFVRLVFDTFESDNCDVDRDGGRRVSVCYANASAEQIRVPEKDDANKEEKSCE